MPRGIFSGGGKDALPVPHPEFEKSRGNGLNKSEKEWGNGGGKFVKTGKNVNFVHFYKIGPRHRIL